MRCKNLKTTFLWQILMRCNARKNIATGTERVQQGVDEGNGSEPLKRAVLQKSDFSERADTRDGMSKASHRR
jgi:hypothetical protein